MKKIITSNRAYQIKINKKLKKIHKKIKIFKKNHNFNYLNNNNLYRKMIRRKIKTKIQYKKVKMIKNKNMFFVKDFLNV